MLNFLKNKEKNIVFDIGSQKIGAISYKVVNNKPMIIDMEYQKNNQNDELPNFLSKNIKKVYDKISNKKDKYTIYCTTVMLIYNNILSNIN